MPDYSVSAINGMSYPLYNGYMNNNSLRNLYDMDMYGSIFTPGMMPYMPAFTGGMNYDFYYNNMKDYLNFTSDYNLQLVENQRKNDLRINATDEAIRNAATILNEKIVENEQKQILGAYNSYLSAVAAKYPNESKENIIARAKTTYAQLYKTSINDEIRKYGHDSFTHGLYNTLTFGLYGGTTPEDNISKITGQPVSRWEKAKYTGGQVAGGVAITTTGILLAKNLKWLTKIPKIGFLYAGIVAAGGAIAAMFGNKN